MNVQKDFSDLCSLLNARRIDFLIIGGYAVAFHGAPRFTGDLDILIRPASGFRISHPTRIGGRRPESECDSSAGKSSGADPHHDPDHCGRLG